MKGFLRGLALACVMFVPCAVARAQETVDSASVSGRVSDPQGAVVPGASVTIRQIDTNVSKESVTDSDGRFRFTYLKVGRYDLTVALEGFAEFHRSLTVSAGSAFELPVQLALASLDASITVTADAPVLETARTQVAVTLSQPEVEAVPSNGRNFLDVAFLAPGVSPTNVASTQLFAETSAVAGGGLSVGSQRNFSNNFIVDGLSANDDAAGLSGMPYSMDAVEQFQVVSSGGQAQLGRALGGYFNVVTKSGTNARRGGAYGYFRDDRLNAANALSKTTLPMDQQQVGGSLGGPISRDRAFYFTNVERRNLNQTGLVTISPANVAAINARLAVVGYPGTPLATGPYANPVDSSNLMGKVDYATEKRGQLSLRYSRYGVSSGNSRGAGGLSAPSASAGLDNLDQAIAVSYTAALSSHTVNEARAQISRGDLKALPSDPVGPAVSIAGVAAFGTLSNSPTGRLNTLYEVVDNLSQQRGHHALRVGVDFLYNDDTITFPRSNRGAYTFSSLSNFLNGNYNNAGFTQTFGATVVTQRNPNVGVYAQDEWAVAPALTVNAGVRYDLQFLQTIQTDTNNVAPRVGFAWSPFASRRTVVRGDAGIFYDRLPLRALANALLSADNSTNLANLQQVNVSLSPGQAGAPVFPGVLSGPVASVTLPNLTTMRSDMKNAYSRQAALEVEHQLGARTTVSAGYQYTRGVGLIISVNQNVPSCVASGTNNGCRPNSTYANDTQYSPLASSSYHGLHVSLTQHPASWGHYRVSYTLSKAMSNVGEFFFSSPIDPFDLSKDWGRSDDDQRHRLVVSGALTAPSSMDDAGWARVIRGFQLSGVVRAYSSLPLNITSGATTVQGTAGRPMVNGAFIPRNAGTGPDFFTLDLRLGRTFSIGERLKLEGFLEGFNLTNRANVVTMNGNFGSGVYPTSPSSSFGQITSVGDPRALQIAVRARF
jgi:carboxypeptidase family protein